MKSYVRIQLMVMMFLQFFTWGSWYGQVTKYLGTTLGASGEQQGAAFSTFSIAMIIAPFFVGMIADRFFSAQKVLGVLNLLGAGFLYLLTLSTNPDSFFWIILGYCLTFTPTLALSTTIAMRQMKSPEQEFPSIRVLGTIAWIIVGNIIGYFGFGDKVTIFQLAIASSVLLGIFSFFLPDTPPSATGPAKLSQILGTDAFVLFKDRSFAIFFLSSVLICIPLSFYYAMANPSLTDSGMTNVENKMSLGQASEVIFMLLLPLAYSRLGVKWTFIVALLAWIVRFLCFGFGDAASGEWILYMAIVLHGVCYDFFFVTGQIYTDNKAGDRIKTQAQSLISFATYGVGMGIGSYIAGLLKDTFTTKTPTGNIVNWEGYWMIPAGIAFVILLLFIGIFREKTTESLVRNQVNA
ncbi:MAG: MFS transporter [Siphonobacter sp.]